MNSRHFRWVFLAIVVGVFYFGNLGHPKIIGSAMEYHDGYYDYAAGSSPSSLAFSGVVLLIYCALLVSKPNEDHPRPVKGVVRRWFTFWLDLAISMAIIAPVIGAIEVFAEWSRTGMFQWSFERTEPASGDVFVYLGTLVFCIVVIAAYFVLPLVLQRPSPGSCIMGYRVVADDARQIPVGMAIKRTASGFSAVVRIFRGLGRERIPEEGKFWVDLRFGTRAVEL